MLPREVFLSHSYADREMAGRVAGVLQEQGIPTFFSPVNLTGGQQWQDEILRALDRCDWFLILLSPDAVESIWVQRETAFALSEARYKDRIIPLSYRPTDLKSLGWLRPIQFVDFQNEFDAGCRELLRVWGVGLG